MLPENKTQLFIPYATKADPEMIQPVPEEYQEQGVKPLDSLPAQYWNWMWNRLTTQFNLSVTTVTSILTELQNVLKLASIVPDEAKEDQLADAIKKLTSDVIGDFADLDFSSDDVKTVVDALNALYDTIKNDIDKRVSAIEDKIPGAASATNKLTDEAFVLRHVATNTANFRGEWQTWEDVPEDGDEYPIDYSGNHDPTENDYMVVRDTSDYNTNTVNIPPQWDVKDWGTNKPVSGDDIWHDNEGNVYYSSGDVQWQLVDGQWATKDWGTNKPDYGIKVWHDNEGNVYYSNGDTRNGQLQLVNGQWVTKDWGIAESLFGHYVWHDDEGNTYLSGYDSNVQYQLVGGQWATKDWGSNKPAAGTKTWRDDEGNIYYSSDNIQWQLVDGQWETKEWGTNKPVSGEGVWRDNEGNVYYSSGNVQWQLVDGQWIDKDWGTNKPAYGTYVWHDNEGNVYYSYGPQYQFTPGHTEAYFKGAWQFKYTGDWKTQGKAGWEPEFSLGSMIDYDQLDERYARGSSKTLDLPNATIDAAGNANITSVTSKKMTLSAPTEEELAAVIKGQVTVNGRRLRICEIDTENHALILW